MNKKGASIMHNFNYFTPTKVVFGKGTENETGKLVKEQNCKKVLIHYGMGSVVRSGLLDKVKSALDAENIPWVELGGAVPNPRLSLVYEGIELAKKEGNVIFGGRLGMYKYFDMHHVIDEALKCVKEYL